MAHQHTLARNHQPRFCRARSQFFGTVVPAVRSDRIRGARRKNFARRMQLLLRTWLCSRKTAIAS